MQLLYYLLAPEIPRGIKRQSQFINSGCEECFTHLVFITAIRNNRFEGFAVSF